MIDTPADEHTCKQLAPCPEIITPNKTTNQWKKKDLLVSLKIDCDFPGKSSHCNTFFFYLAQCSLLQDDHIIMGKDAKGKGKGKGKTRPKRVKAENVPVKEQDVK